MTQARDRILIGGGAALAVAVPMILLWPRAEELREPPAIAMTTVPPVSLALQGSALTVPLFNAARSPEPPASPDAADPSVPAQAAAPPVLVGIALGRGGGVALVKSANGDTVQLGLGDEVDGWRLVALTRDHASIEQNGERVDLTFDFNNRPAASGRPTPPAATAPIPLPPPRAGGR